MQVDKSKIILINKHPRANIEAQRELGLKMFPDGHVIELGKICLNAIQAAKSFREDDRVWFYALGVLVVAPRKADGLPQNAQLTELMAAVPRGVVMFEGATGRTTADPKQRRAMIKEAHANIRQGGKRLPKGSLKSGRPTKRWPSIEVREAATKMWNSRNIPTDAAAVREIMARYSDLVDDKGNPRVTDRLIRGLGKTHRNR